MNRVEILGVNVDTLNKKDLLNSIRQDIKLNNKKTIISINPKKIMLCQQNKELREFINNAEYLIPDSHRIAKSSRLIPEKITGIDLMKHICSEITEAKIFLYGATRITVMMTKFKLQEMYKHIQIVGFHDGFLNGQDVVKEINNSGANVLFVALGSPKQEQWIERNKDKLHVNIIMGVGGSFDVISRQCKKSATISSKYGVRMVI